MWQPCRIYSGGLSAVVVAGYFVAALAAEAFAAVFTVDFVVDDLEEADAVFAFAVDATCVVFARTCVSGARCTGSVTASVLCGLIAVDDRWFHRRRSSTDTLKRSAIVTRVSPLRVM